jgi:hypothetical protein
MTNFCVDTGDLIAKLADADAEIKRLEELNKILTDKYCKDLFQLRRQIKNLKCCGNCTYFYDNECSKFPEIDGEYCDKWEDDTLTQEDRK